jgi:hypothetical protein
MATSQTSEVRGPVSLPVQFHDNVVDLSALIIELTQMCSDAGLKDANPIVMNLAKAYFEGMNTEEKKVDLLEGFITYSVPPPTETEPSPKPYWEQITKRDEKFFIDNARKVFKDLEKYGQTDAFKNLFVAADSTGKYIICQEDRNAIWDFFDSLVKIAVKYIHQKREPYLKDGKKAYHTSYMKNISLTPYVKHYGIELAWD